MYNGEYLKIQHLKSKYKVYNTIEIKGLCEPAHG